MKLGSERMVETTGSKHCTTPVWQDMALGAASPNGAPSGAAGTSSQGSAHGAGHPSDRLDVQ